MSLFAVPGQALLSRLLGGKETTEGPLTWAVWIVGTPTSVLGVWLPCCDDSTKVGSMPLMFRGEGQLPEPREQPSFPASKLLPRTPALSPESQHLCFKALGFPGSYRGPSHRPCPCLPPQAEGRDCCLSVKLCLEQGLHGSRWSVLNAE